MEKMKKATEIGVIDDSGPPKKGGGGGRRKGKRDDGEIHTSDDDEGAPGGEGAEGSSKDRSRKRTKKESKKETKAQRKARKKAERVAAGTEKLSKKQASKIKSKAFLNSDSSSSDDDGGKKMKIVSRSASPRFSEETRDLFCKPDVDFAFTSGLVMVQEVSEVERKEELKVGAGAGLVQGLQGPDQGRSRAQSLDQDQGLAQNLDLESPGPGQSADRGPGVDPRGPGVGPRGLEVGQEGPDPGRPSQAAAQGRALAVRRGLGPKVEQDQGLGVLGGGQGQAAQQNQDQEAQQSQGQAVQGDQDPGVLPNPDLEVQQGQGPQAHQGQGQGLPKVGEVDHQFNCTGYVLLLFVSCGLKCPYIIG